MHGTVEEFKGTNIGEKNIENSALRESHIKHLASELVILEHPEHRNGPASNWQTMGRAAKQICCFIRHR
jgi:hypothetical protein